MNGLQKLTAENSATAESTDDVKPEKPLTQAQEDYIAFVAVGGLIPDPTGEKSAIKMTTTQFAAHYGLSRQALYNWRDMIPEFWEKVNAKRREIGSKDRLSNVWNGIYLKAATGNTEAAKLYLANFDPNFRMPTEKREIEMGDGLADLVAARILQQSREENRPKVIDVESQS